MIKCSIIIVSYNTKALTLRCLESIFKFEKGVEVIIVDNNSTDGTVNEIKKNFPKVIILENSSNLGFAKANNQAINRSSGEYIMLLNSDTEFIASSIDILINQFINGEISAVVPQLLNSDTTIQPSVFRLPTLTRTIKQYWLNGNNEFEKYIPELKDGVGYVESAVMAAMIIPKDIIKRIGMLDERFFMYFEDLEFCRRLNKSGYKILYTNKVQIMHHHGASGGNQNANSWRRLIPSSKIYHGWLTHYLIYLVMKSSLIMVKIKAKLKIK